MYTVEDLKIAFEAGSEMTFKDLAGYEGIYHGDPVDYEDFETWLELFIKIKKDA